MAKAPTANALASSEINLLVMSYLARSGFDETAEAFRKEAASSLGTVLEDEAVVQGRVRPLELILNEYVRLRSREMCMEGALGLPPATLYEIPELRGLMMTARALATMLEVTPATFPDATGASRAASAEAMNMVVDGVSRGEKTGEGLPDTGRRRVDGNIGEYITTKAPIEGAQAGSGRGDHGG